MQANVKLTIRIPAELHHKLKLRAGSTNRSLNIVISETLERGLEHQEEIRNDSERERILRILRDSGLLSMTNTKWEQYDQNAPKISHAELREKLKGLPPLSELIIEEREPR